MKIGFTTEPVHRIQSLATALHGDVESWVVLRGTLEQEQALHSRFQRIRLKGEWFKPNRELTYLISRFSMFGVEAVMRDLPPPASAGAANV